MLTYQLALVYSEKSKKKKRKDKRETPNLIPFVTFFHFSKAKRAMEEVPVPVYYKHKSIVFLICYPKLLSFTEILLMH